MTMRVLVTGATGFLGHHLVRRLLAERHEVAAIVRSRAAAPTLPPSVRQIVYTTDRALPDAIGNFGPVAVVHLASRYVAEHRPEDVGELIASNIVFGAHLLDAMAQCAVTKLLNFGTSFQHYLGDAYHPVSLYAATKQAFEDLALYYVKAHNFSVLTLKLSDTYGPDDNRQKIVSLLRRATETGETISLSPGHQIVNFAHCDDVVAAVLVGLDRLIAKSGGMEAFAIRGDELLTLRAFVETFAELSGRAIDVAWGAKPYRKREVMEPWQGPLLPGWRPKIDLRGGLQALLDD